MKFRFKPSDFQALDISNAYSELAEDYKIVIAARANEVLQKYLEACPKVYGVNGGLWSQDLLAEDTHTAILYGIEPMLPPHECEPSAPDQGSTWKPTCRTCGESLRPVKWVRA